METLLYYLARTIVAGARCLPLRALAWVGRRLGGLAWILDKPVSYTHLTLPTICSV